MFVPSVGTLTITLPVGPLLPISLLTTRIFTTFDEA